MSESIQTIILGEKVEIRWVSTGLAKFYAVWIDAPHNQTGDVTVRWGVTPKHALRKMERLIRRKQRKFGLTDRQAIVKIRSALVELGLFEDRGVS